MEGVREEARQGEGRCPFCHDGFEAALAPGDRPVACALCRAPHHAECFVESQKCAATGCGSTDALVGDERVPVGALAARVAQGDVGGERVSVLSLAVVLAPLLGAGFAAVAYALGFPVVSSIAIVVAAVAFLVLGIVALGRPSRAVRVEPALAPDPIHPDVALSRAFPGIFESADPYEPIRRRIEREEGPAPASFDSGSPSGRSLAQDERRCPSCGAALDSEGSEPLRFCYHCGVALGP